MTIAVIADIVGSRLLPDRSRAQAAFEATMAQVEKDHPLATEPLRPTVGDEFQAVYPRLADALGSLLLVQLALPEGLECRFGIGIGAIGPFASGAGTLSDGPGWWSARDAIDHVHRLQQRAAPSARTWVVVAPEEDGDMHRAASLANAYLLARDQVVGAMGERARRLTYGRCRGVTQRELAAAEGITQPAVSQALTAAGSAAVVEGFLALGAGEAV